MSYPFIQQYQKLYPVRLMCRVLALSPSGYYRWRQQPQSQRAKRNEKLLADIKLVHQQSRQSYVAPKIQQALRQQGIRLGVWIATGQETTFRIFGTGHARRYVLLLSRSLLVNSRI